MKCKALTKHGTHCCQEAVIGGYCIMHYWINKKREEPIKWQEKHY